MRINTEKILEPLAKSLQEYTAMTYAILEVLCERDPEFAEDFRVAYETQLERLRESWANTREIAALEALLGLDTNNS